ncbi:MAG: hypothetical protein KJZ86_27235 [Caldilineaceae bacterium]|nr:hypothetical protein [Caldilineaceae bacterium]HRJ43951.1 hypothetical protein [Caldilineaceae bacterium]
MAMGQAAVEMGATTFQDDVTVSGFDIQDGKLRAVLTDSGRAEPLFDPNMTNLEE